MTLKNLAMAILLFGAMVGVSVADAFQDPLDQPALMIGNPASESLQAVVYTGTRFVAVGMRGVVVVSDDEGKSWQQIKIPVSADLLAVQFIDAKRGWISGDSGVVLRTVDGGNTWERLVDGRILARQVLEQYQKKVTEGDPDAAGYLKEIQANFEAGPEVPILGIWFENESDGFAVSTFGMLFATTDGGSSWQSWMERVNDSRRLHYYSINGIAGDVYLTAEQGAVFRLDRQQRRFVALDTGYSGGLFGITGDAHKVVAFGLQGHAFISANRGDSWLAMHPPPGGGINAGLITQGGELLLATQDGRVLAGQPAVSARFESLPLKEPMLFTGLAVSHSRLVVTGFAGLQSVEKNQRLVR